MTKTLRKSIAWLMAFALIFQFFGNGQVLAADALTDISSHWAKEAIESLVDQSVLTGYPDNTFKPNNSISRAEFTTVMTKSLQLEPTVTYEFRDLMFHWSQTYIGAAVDYGLLDSEDYLGDEGKTNFSPDTAITRGEMAMMIVRAMGAENEAMAFTGSLDQFTDASSIPAYQTGYIASAAEAGIITGYPDGNFGADKTATRAEACIMLTRLADYLAAAVTGDAIDSEDIYSLYSNNVAKIYNYDATGALAATGTGFLMDASGKLITNYHVIDGASTMEAEFIDGSVYPVTIITNYDASKDVAVLEIGPVSGNVNTLSLGNDRQLKTGSKIYTMGYPLGQELSITDGLISSGYNKIYDEYYLQISAPISSGNSGGPLINKYGQIVGINTLKTDTYAENMNYSVPVSFIAEVLNEDHAMTMEAFATRNTDIVDAYNVSVLSHTYYGLNSETGEMVAYEDEATLFDLNQVDTFMQEIVLGHDPVQGDNLFEIGTYIMDGDADYYDYNYSQTGLSDSKVTILQITYQPYEAPALDNGLYIIETYMTGDLYSDTELVFSDGSGFGDLSLKNSDMYFFDGSLYLEEGEVDEKDTFISSKTGYIGIYNELTYDQDFDAYTPILLRYELTMPDGEIATFYDTNFTLPDSNSGISITSWGSSFRGTFDPGDYSLKVYCGDDFIMEDSFKVIEKEVTTMDLEIDGLTFYDSDGTEKDDFTFNDRDYFGITMTLDDLSYDTVIDYGYIITTESARDSISLEDGYNGSLALYTDEIGTSFTVFEDPLYIPSELKDNIYSNEALYVDFYLDGEFAESFRLADGFPEAPAYTIAGAALSWADDAGFTLAVEDPYNEEAQSLFDIANNLLDENADTLSLSEGNGQGLIYVIDIDEESLLEDQAYYQPVTIQLLSGDTLVAQYTELSALWTDLYEIVYIDLLRMEDGSELATGSYTLQVLYGDDTQPLYSETFTLVE